MENQNEEKNEELEQKQEQDEEETQANYMTIGMSIKYLLLVSVLSFTIILSGCGTPSLSEPIDDITDKALLAYQEILKAAPAIEGEPDELMDASFGYEQNLEMFGNHYDMFALFDINQDGTSELITLSVINFRWTPVSVYTYADGKAVLLKDPLDAEADETFAQISTANGAYITYFCEEHHIHSVWRGANPMGEAVEENSAYILEGTTLIATDCAVGESENTVYFYDIAKANVAENVDAM